MANLLALPNELILEIYQQVFPGDLVSFACVSKRLHVLGQRALVKHHTWALVYQEINDRYGHDVPAVLLRILRNPGLAWYIKRVVIDRYRGLNEDWLERLDPQDMPTDDLPGVLGLDGALKPSGPYPFTTSDIELIVSTLQSRLFPDAKGVSLHSANSLYNFTENIVNGDDGPLKLLLALLSPNLNTLVITADSQHRDDEETFVEYMSSVLRHTALLPRACSIFDNLRVVRINHWTEKRHPHGQIALSIDEFAPFFTLRAIEELAIGIAGHDYNDPYEWEYTHGSSPLKHWDAGMTEFKTGELASLLSGISSLRSFRPASWHEIDLYQQFHGDSLEVLHLGATVPPNGLPLTNFRVLKDLSLSSVLLAPTGTDAMARTHFTFRSNCGLRHILPHSIENLRIYLYHETHPRSSSDPNCTDSEYRHYLSLVTRLVSFIEGRTENCPNLQSLYLHEPSALIGPGLIELPGLLEACCAYYGVGLSFVGAHTPCPVCRRDLSVLGAGIDQDEDSPGCSIP
ncbi:hypothetical protein MMC18_006184 [Xylographa bjoerkii]|nr:hypothetical protein [Xylographa bjoerkii]